MVILEDLFRYADSFFVEPARLERWTVQRQDAVRTACF